MESSAHENAEHIAVAQYLRSLPWVLWMHPANGGYRFRSTARLLQRMGVSPGAPDLLIFTPGPLSGRPLAIEMKSRSKTARVTPAQTAWLERLTDIGWDAHVCYGASEAFSVLQAAGYGCRSETPGQSLESSEKEPKVPVPRVSKRNRGAAKSVGSLGQASLGCSLADSTPKRRSAQALS